MKKFIRSIAIVICAVCMLSHTDIKAQAVEAYILSTCPVTSPDAQPVGEKADPLTGLIVQMLITKGIDMAASALTEAAKDKVTRLEVPHSAAAPYYKMAVQGSLSVSKELGCLVILAKGTGTDQTPWRPRLSTRLAGLKVLAKVETAPDLYFEAEIQPSQSSQGLLVSPRMLYLRKPLLEGSGWFRKSDKDYVLTTSFLDDATDTAFGALTFAFKGVDTGTTWVGRESALVEGGKVLSGWPSAMSVPKLPLNDDIKEAQGAQKAKVAPFQEANAVRKRVLEMPLQRGVVESNQAYRDAVEALCTAIAKERPKPQTGADKADKSSGGPSDPRCPFSVWKARMAADLASTTATAALNLKWADEFHQRKCVLPGLTDNKPITVPAGTTVTMTLCALPIADSVDQGSFKIRAVLVETSEAGKFLKALASAFEQQKDTVSARLNDELNPVRREQLAKAEEVGERDARQKFQLALLKVAQLEASLAEAAASTASARKTIEIQLVQAKIDANAAARLNATPSPYPEYD